MLLIERLRAALAPDYEVERELAGGGMGIVFVGRQRRLDRPVAIKLLRPELATAVAAERFRAEGRLLAKLKHPNIVPVYDADERDGLLYYVMELIDGETLADRLERGPLSAAEAFELARDLLAALGEAHAQGVVHRDIKPANIFLRQGRALLGDFGIARWRESKDAGLTTPGQLIGTPRYMAPEQLDGSEATPQVDVYAAGMVIFEACAGPRRPGHQAPAAADWHRVPRELVPQLKRALALAPEERWPDGQAFAKAIAPPKRRGAVAVLGAAAVAAIAAVLLLPRGDDSRRSSSLPLAGYTLSVSRFGIAGQSADSSLGDSVTASFKETLSGNLDFFLVDTGSAAVKVTGRGEVSGDRLTLTLSAVMPGQPTAEPITRSEAGSGADWRRLTHDLASALLRALFEQDAKTDVWLPRNAIPETPRGLDLWIRAEQLLSHGRWEEAGVAYRLAVKEDSTCYLCSFRLLDIDRWLGNSPDSARVRHVGGALAKFPPHYQLLIKAALSRPPNRLPILKNAVDSFPGFFLASFEYGDELFHRGALDGHARIDALEPFQLAVRLKPRFGPGWEHLAWLQLSEGSLESVTESLDSLSSMLPGSGFSASLQVLLQLGKHWRFLAPDSAERFTRWILSRPEIMADPRAAAGGRLLMTTDAPNGAVAMGRMLTEVWPNRPDAVREGLLAQLFGSAALGRLDSMRAVRRRLLQKTPDQSLALLALQLEALLLRFDPDSALRAAPDVILALRRYVEPNKVSPQLRRRAGWTLGLLALEAGDTGGIAAARAALRDEPKPNRLSGMFEAAARGVWDPAAAIRLLPARPGIDVLPGEEDDPLEDAAARLLTAEWMERSGDQAGALRALLWHEHLQTIRHGSGPPQPGEMGWALATLARWHHARLLSSSDATLGRCADLVSVARRWALGEPRFAILADSAKAMAARECELRR